MLNVSKVFSNDIEKFWISVLSVWHFLADLLSLFVSTHMNTFLGSFFQSQYKEAVQRLIEENFNKLNNMCGS